MCPATKTTTKNRRTSTTRDLHHRDLLVAVLAFVRASQPQPHDRLAAPRGRVVTLLEPQTMRLMHHRIRRLPLGAVMFGTLTSTTQYHAHPHISFRQLLKHRIRMPPRRIQSQQSRFPPRHLLLRQGQFPLQRTTSAFLRLHFQTRKMSPHARRDFLRL